MAGEWLASSWQAGTQLACGWRVAGVQQLTGGLQAAYKGLRAASLQVAGERLASDWRVAGERLASGWRAACKRLARSGW